MKHYLTNEIKNIVLVGSSKSGKTTLAECMMFEGGVINRMGTIDDGNTISDYHEIEHERKNSVFCSIMHTEWRGTKINLLDTPGQDDFIGETIPALRISGLTFSFQALHLIAIESKHAQLSATVTRKKS